MAEHAVGIRISFNCSKCQQSNAKCFCEYCQKYRCEECFRDICAGHITRSSPMTLYTWTGQYLPGQSESVQVLHLNDIVKGCEEGASKYYLIHMDQKLLKKLNVDFFVEDECTLPDRPWGACSYIDNGEHRLAVTIRALRKVVIMETMPKLRITNAFPVPDRCRGIAAHGSRLIVACGGNDSHVDGLDEGPGQVVVFSLAGVMLSTLTEGLSQPYHVKVGYRGHIYICDRDNGILVCKLVGDVLNKETIRRCTRSSHHYTVTETEHGELYVGCFNSGTITKFATDGQEIGIVLSSNRHIMRPLCILYDKQGNTERLIVTNEGSDNIQVFEGIY